MKKKTLLILLAMALLFTGCTSDEPVEVAETVDEEIEEGLDEKIEDEPVEEEKDLLFTLCKIDENRKMSFPGTAESEFYKVEEVNVEESVFKIDYPKVDLFEFPDANEAINKKLNSIAMWDMENLFDYANDEEDPITNYNMTYGISFADDNYVSFCFQGELESRSGVLEDCEGATLDVKTGDKLTLSNFIDITNLEGLVKEGNCIIVMDQGYDEDTVQTLLEDFDSALANDMYDLSACYFLEEGYVDIIVPFSQHNSTYIMLKIPR